jgi:DNA polymerase III sliding clamp (beta) subunit (PCNA family)
MARTESLVGALKRVVYATESDGKRFPLHCLLFTGDRVVAADSFRLATSHIEPLFDRNAIITRENVCKFLKVFDQKTLIKKNPILHTEVGEKEKTVQMSELEKTGEEGAKTSTFREIQYIRFVTPSTTFMTRVAESDRTKDGEVIERNFYPSWRQVIPNMEDYLKVRVGRNDLLQGAEPIRAMATDRTRAVALRLDEGCMNLTYGHPDHGNSGQTVRVEYDDTHIPEDQEERIVNIDFLIETLERTSSENLIMAFPLCEEERPICFYPADEEVASWEDASEFHIICPINRK